MAATEAVALRALLDVNVLIALHDQQHIHHAVAARWFEEHAHQGWASCPLTQNGCVRIMSQPGYPNAAPLADVLSMLGRSCAHVSHRFWPDDISLLDEARLHRGRMHGHRQLTDLYLLALAVAHEGRFVTFDARIPINAVRGAVAAHLVSI
jgi:uncharacterized protein